ncbi:MAG: formate dehydrogenase subunit alpha [Bacteroidales bacterium]|nr:formate dehydrogenase subunit alpha [Bacteroidales bacterium]
MSKRVNLTIEGKQIQAPEGANLLQVALDNGIQIPFLCYHKKLSPTGACRMCVVKIEGQKGLTMSCTVKAEEGMLVTAFDDELESARKRTLEYLLAEHNDHHDGTYYDEFWFWVQYYNLDRKYQRSYPNIYKHMHYPVDDTSPVLSYDGTKCIKCFRCIKACDEVQGKNVLSFSQRGIASYIVAGIDKWSESECDGCGECVQLCPTGALVDKPHRDEINLNRIDKRVRTTCPYCGVGCQIMLYVQDGKIVRSDGVEDVAPNDGRLCVKGRYGYDYVQSEDRLTTPLIKKNGEFVESSWEEALDLIAKKFSEIKEKYGSEALGGYGSAKCTNEDNYIFQKFIRIVFGNNNLDYCTRLCHASTVTAMLKSLGSGAGSNSIEDFANTDCLFVTGNNMVETHPVTATFAKNGKYKGNKIIVCDPKWTTMVKYADIWLQPRLGTDVALLNGMIHIIIKENLIDKEFIKKRVDGGMKAYKKLRDVVDKYTPEETERITGVPREKFTEAARIYAKSSTAMIATGMGLSQQQVGTHMVFSLINMMLITGQIGKERAGIDPPRGQNNVQGVTDIGVSPINYPGYIPVGNEENRRKLAGLWDVPFESLPSEPGLTTVQLVNAAHEGQIKGMYIMGENPMMTDPDLNHTEESLKNLDFLVVQDIFHTETTPYADVILPASSYAEKNGTFVNSDRRVLRVRKALEMPGQAEEDWKIIVNIAERMGYNIGQYNNAKEIFEEIREATPIMAGVTYWRIVQDGLQWPCPTIDHPGTKTLFLEKFSTSHGLGILNPVEYEQQSETPSRDFPYVLNTGRILYQYHTSTMSRRNKALNDFANETFVLMNPADVKKNGFRDGDQVKLSNKRGELETMIRESESVAEGELFMPFHFRESLVNKLTRGDLDPHSRIPPYKFSVCKVEKI